MKEETYQYEIDCGNCGQISTVEQIKGNDRPVKATCPYCRCYANTKTKKWL